LRRGRDDGDDDDDDGEELPLVVWRVLRFTKTIVCVVVVVDVDVETKERTESLSS
jgi:hypothetical protein